MKSPLLILSSSLAVFAFSTALASPASGQAVDPLAPVDFLVGEFGGQGKHEPWGVFDQVTGGQRALAGSVLILRSRCRMGEGEVAFEDMKIFSYDSKTKLIRARQYLPGVMVSFKVTVEAKGRLLLTETGNEGRAHPERRIRYQAKADGWNYRVESKGAKGFAASIEGKLQRRAPDTRRAGTEAFAGKPVSIRRAKGPAMAGEVFYPKAGGPRPVVIFSPGGGAPTIRNYERFGRHFASWGYITVVVAFNNRSAEERAVNFAEVADWLAAQNGDASSPLKGRLNLKKLVAAGHSFGGYSAILAAQRDPRFTACLAYAPSGPRGKFAWKRSVPTLVLVGDGDRFLSTDEAIYKTLTGRRYFAAVRGMDHFFNPSNLFPEVVGLGTAFLKAEVDGDLRYRAVLKSSSDLVRARGDD